MKYGKQKKQLFLYWNFFYRIIIWYLGGAQSSRSFSSTSQGDGFDWPVPEFSLINQNNKTIHSKDLLGKVYVVEFFFTTCPSICPIMHESMVKVQDKYFGNPSVAFVSITINPEIDTPEVLAAYANENKVTNSNWHFLTGDLKDIYALANQGFNLYVAEAPEVEGGFEHSGFFALVDQEGNIRSRLVDQENPKIYYNGLEDSDVKMLVDDIKKLL